MEALQSPVEMDSPGGRVLEEPEHTERIENADAIHKVEVTRESESQPSGGAAGGMWIAAVAPD